MKTSPPTSSRSIREVVHKLRFVRLTLRLIWDAASRWTVLWAVLLLLQGTIPAGIVYVTKWLVDGVAAAVGAGVSWETGALVVVPGLVMAGLMLAQRVLGSLSEWVSTAQAELVGDHLKGLVHEKAASVSYGYYESAEYHDQLEQVTSQANARTLQLLQNVGSLGQASVTLVTIAAILLQYSLWLPLALVVSTLPAFLVVLRHNRKYYAWWHTSTPRRRLAQYFDLMLTLDQAAAEVRINNLGAYFRSEYQALRERLRTERLALLRRQVIARLFAATLALVVTGAVMVWIGLRALRGQATLGDLALFYQAFNQGQSLVGALLQNMGQIYTHTLFLEHLFDFLDQESTVLDPEEPVPFPPSVSDGIRFEGVTFAYPGSERNALESFDMELPAGKIVAIVGENGAGKSTFVKLLCRFYDPEEGRITVDGVDLRNFRQADLRQRISVMFQFPMKYQFTAEKNVRLGDLESEAGKGRVETAAVAAGADAFLQALPSGYDTLLGRWFAGGHELSGGQWQRVALARAFFRDASLVVLDEPTSSMDSWAENDWFARFRTMVEGRSALIITHRFTTAMQADIIHVMHEGRVVESGSHAELIARGGRYASSWHTQMRKGEEAGHADEGLTGGDGSEVSSLTAVPPPPDAF